MLFLGLIGGVIGLIYLLFKDYRYRVGWYERTMYLLEVIFPQKNKNVIEAEVEKETEL